MTPVPRGLGEAYVGGWCTASPNPTKDTVFGFHYAITADAHPWAFKDGNPQKRIAALELLGTLLLCKHLVAQQGQLPGRVRFPVGSDNSGNIFSLLNLSAKEPYSAALLMELVLFLHCEGCSIAPNHVAREYNTWADELTHPDFEGFSLDCPLPAAETLFVFLLPQDCCLRLDFLRFPPKIPCGSGGLSSRPCPWHLDTYQGTLGCLAGMGESYCLTHPCPPGEAQGILKLTKRYRVWGRTPASIKAH